MMYKSLQVILATLLFHCVIGQVEVPEGKYPYHTFIEWPGNGGLMINSDPAEKARDFNMVFINEDSEVQWQETIYPKTFNVTPIVSMSSNYIYFFDQLEIEKNKLYYHQINSNGSVKSTSVDFLRDLKQLGYTNPDDAMVQNIINTEKALVIQLLIENKSEKVYDHILFFLTHHNHRIYTAKMTPTNFNNFKADFTGVPYFAGSEGTTIYFAQMTNAANKPKVTFFPFNEKGVKGNEVTLSIPNYKPLECQFKTFIPDGYNEVRGVPYYSNTLGFAFFTKGQFYFSQINSENKSFEIMRYTDKGEFETVYTGAKVEPEKRRFSVEQSLYFNGVEWVFITNVAEQLTAVEVSGEEIEKLEINHDIGKNAKFNHALLTRAERMDYFIIPTKKGGLVLPKKELPQKEKLIFKTL